MGMLVDSLVGLFVGFPVGESVASFVGAVLGGELGMLGAFVGEADRSQVKTQGKCSLYLTIRPWYSGGLQ
jgi:hypothetical protein